MSDASNAVKHLRERLTGASEDHLGKALSDLLDNPLLTGTIGRAFDARERAAQAQELAMGVLNVPSAADIERLTRRLRSVSQRLEGIEDGVHRLDRALATHGVDRSEIGQQLSKIEEQLGTITKRLSDAAPSARKRPVSAARASKPTAAKASRLSAAKASKPSAAKASRLSAAKASKPSAAKASKPSARGSAASSRTAKPKKA